MRYWTCLSVVVTSSLWCAVGQCEMPSPSGGFNGLDMNLGNLYRMSHAQSRSISAENFSGEKGKAGMASEGIGKDAARELGQGWKVSPAARIKGKSTFTLAEINGSARSIRSGSVQPPTFAGPGCSSSASIGTARPSLRSKCRWAISSHADGASTARSTRCPSASIPTAR